MYDYRKSLLEDVKEAIKENYEETLLDVKSGNISREDFEEQLNEDLWTDDSVTGNGSGSYYCNTWKAEESLCHNWELIEEVAENFGYKPIVKSGYEFGAEWWDVSIRCYLLAQAISEALDEILDD